MHNGTSLAGIAALAGAVLGAVGCSGPDANAEVAVVKGRIPAVDVEMQSHGYDGPCIPYGMRMPKPVVFDPSFDQPSTPKTETTLLPTCKPAAPIPSPTPGPAPTPMPSRIAPRGQGPAVRVSSEPRNVTLSPWSESLGRVAAGPRVTAVTWDQWITLFTGSGTKSMKTSDVLGVSTRAGVGVSPQGRIHVAGGGRYAYSDDDGVTWSSSSASPVGGDPFVVVEPDGCARAFWQAGDLWSAKQRFDGGWEAPVSLGGSGGDYDAVRTEDAVVVLTASGSVWRVPGDGMVATLRDAERVDLNYVHGELLAGLACKGRKAVIARSLDGGHTWSECLVQRTREHVRDVAAVPTTQGPYAVLWVRDNNHFPTVMLSKAHWKASQVCGVWPEVQQVDQLEVPYIGSPRLFGVACPQTSFRVDTYEGMVFMAFTCVDDADETDIFVVELSADGFFSGPALGGSRAGEGAYQDDYLGPLD